MITVKDLLKACQAEIKKGNGDKTIYISADDEGNSFHEMYYLFTSADGFDELTSFEPEVDDPDSIIILG